MTGFRYKRVKKKERIPVPEIARPTQETEEIYYGSIDGKDAAKGEENCLKAAYGTGRVLGHEFRRAVGAPPGMPGWKELDFLFGGTTGKFWAVQIKDFDFVHKGQESEGKDLATDTYILEKLREEGYDIDKIITISDDDLDTAEAAKRTMEAVLV